MNHTPAKLGARATRARPDAPAIEGHQPKPRRPDRVKANELDHSQTTYTVRADGRPSPRGYTFKRSEARKVVPRRRFNLRTPHGLLKRHAYHMDVTRAQMADALGVSVRTFDAYIGYRRELLRPWMVNALAPVLGLTPDDIAAIHAAGVADLGWEPRQ